MDKRLIIDIGERAALTFAQAFLAVILANAAGMTDVATLKAAALAGLAAALAVLKGAAASRLGEKGTAALLPAPGPDA